MQPGLLLTPGEPAGIGPDLVVLNQGALIDAGITLVADPELLSTRASLLKQELSLQPVTPDVAADSGKLAILPVSLQSPVEAGTLNAANAPYVLETLSQAVDLCLQGRYRGIITGPVHKGIINDAGIPFSGHTEFLAERTSTPQVVMMLAAGDLRVALATTHLPLREVADAITQPLITSVLRILHHDLQHQFGISSPRILVCGLNPHAGEGGHLGTEEIQEIEPALTQLRKEGMHLTGPLPADTLFTPTHLSQADAVLAMYHDQGLPVLKHHGFGNAVNITLGLPIIRTSVDHGTALDLAGTGQIDSGSLLQALNTARSMVA